MRKLIILLAGTALLLPLAFASAEDNASVRVNAKAEVKLGPAIKVINRDTAHGSTTASTTVKARVAEIKAAIAEHKVAIKEKARERWSEKAQGHLEKILERLSDKVDKLENVSARLNTRIEKLKGQGFTMASSTSLLLKANADIQVANEKALGVSAAFEAALASSTPKEHMGAVRAAVSAVEDAIRKAKQSLVAVIRSIRLEAGARADVE